MLDGEIPLVLYGATSEEDEHVDDEQVDERQRRQRPQEYPVLSARVQEPREEGYDGELGKGKTSDARPPGNDGPEDRAPLLRLREE